MNNALSDLVLNPVTLIALGLAAFFSMMAFMRSRESRRKEKALGRDPSAKPYRVADPFAPPQAPPAATLPPATLTPHPHSATSDDNSHKFFRQFGPTPDGSGGAAPTQTSGYLWE